MCKMKLTGGIEMKMINIAIDGPAGAGKSSVARAVSAELGYLYVDTGALYRVVALYMILNRLTENADIIGALGKFTVRLGYENGEQRVFLDGNDMSDIIRSTDVSMAASKVSAIPEVRAFLFDLQRNIARENSVIMDGRDIGTVVLPDADVKIFLTAAPEERAKRRLLEMAGQPDCPEFAEILADIVRRDEKDMNRAAAPLKQAEDAVFADTTGLSFEESVALVKKIICGKIGVFR